MKDIEKTIRESFILLIGVGLFTYGLFSFISIVAKSSKSYHYEEDINSTLVYLIIGIVAIVFWSVKKKRIEEKDNLNNPAKSIKQSLKESLPGSGLFILLGIIFLVCLLNLLILSII